MRVYELITAYANRMTANTIIEMEDASGDNIIIYDWEASEHRNDFDGSYSNVLWHIPEEIAQAEIESFEVMPQHLILNNEIITLGDTETLYIIIPAYTKLYKYRLGNAF